jgi:hypothetical protein
MGAVPARRCRLRSVSRCVCACEHRHFSRQRATRGASDTSGVNTRAEGSVPGVATRTYGLLLDREAVPAPGPNANTIYLIGAE